MEGRLYGAECRLDHISGQFEQVDCEISMVAREVKNGFEARFVELGDALDDRVSALTDRVGALEVKVRSVAFKVVMANLATMLAVAGIVLVAIKLGSG